MKIHEYNEMMAYLTRPAMNIGGRVGLKPGGIVEPGVGRQGYGGPGSGAKKGLHPRLTSAEKRATRYKKILENLPEGYFDEYVKNFYNVDKKTEKLTHVGGGLNPEKGIPYMEKKYGNILKETLPSMPDLEIKDVNAAVKKSIEDQIESGLNRGERLRKIDLKAIGDWYPKAPKGMVTHHFLPKVAMEGTDLNYASSRNTAFISRELNSKMSPYDTKLKANQKEQIKLLNEKLPGWEKKIEDLNTRSRALVKNAAREIPGSAGYLGFSEMKITSEGKPIFETRGIDYNKSLSGINKADAVIYKNISDADKIRVNKMSNIKSNVINKIKNLIGNANIGIKPTDNQKIILSKINKAPIPKKVKVALLGVVGGVAAITGADLMTSDLQAAETETAAEEKDTGIPYEAGAATAATLGKYGPQIWRGVKTVGKTVLKPVMSPLAGAGFAASELMSEDPNVSLAGLELLWPDILKRLGSKVSTAKKFYDTVLRMGVAPRLVPHLIKGMTGAGLVMIAGDVAYKVATESQPGMLIDKETGEPKAFDREKASFVMPTMIDAYEQASKYAQENKIPYEEAFKTLFGDKTFREGIDETIKKQGAFNQGGRVGFAKGPKDPSKRAFIKGVTALAAIPLVGRFFKVGKFLERGSTYMGPVIEKVKGMPDWFPGLVKKLWNEGEDVTEGMSYKERVIVKRGTLEGGDDVDMFYDLDTGDVNIEVVGNRKSGIYKSGETSSGAYNKEYSLEYKKSQADEMTKGKKPPDEFGVNELEGRMDPHAIDVDWDVNMTTVDDAMSDLTEIEAFAKNKTTKQIHKKKGTKKKDVFPDYDPSWDDYDID